METLTYKVVLCWVSSFSLKYNDNSLFIDESLDMFNLTRNDVREQVMAAGLTDEALLSGDLNTVERLVYNNETQV